MKKKEMAEAVEKLHEKIEELKVELAAAKAWKPKPYKPVYGLPHAYNKK